LILFRAFHPINVAVTAYVLLMLIDYSWKAEESCPIIDVLEKFKLENNSNSLLQPFAECIYETDNILMCYYNLKFINQLLASIVDDDGK
jgi:hypothetical protein